MNGRRLGPGLALLLALVTPVLVTSAPPERDRSPSDLALTADGRWAITANTTSDTASLVDLSAGKVVAEIAVGQRPTSVALSADARQAAVTNWLGDSLSVLHLTPGSLTPHVTIPVGDEPRGVVFSPDGTKAFVALSGEGAVAVVDLAARRVTDRISVGTEPWHLDLSPDGKRLAVGASRSMHVAVIDVPTLQVAHRVSLYGRNVRGVAVSPDGNWAYVTHIAERGFSTTREHIDQGWVVASRLSRVPLRESGPREAISLDPQREAVADVDGVAVSPDGQTLAVSAGGTHELLLLRHPLPFIAYGGPGDHIDPALLRDAQRFRRIPLGGRPLGVKFTPDGRQVVVANYLQNALQVVEVASGKVARTISLGGPAEPSLARKGEAIFYDAQRSFSQWYSCNSCHTDGHTNGGEFDTLNDGKYGNAKKTLSLRGVVHTGPYTWHGWQADLRESVHGSFVKSMQGPEPSKEDLDAVMAYLETLDFVPSPHRAPDGSLTEAARRGEAVFQTKKCTNCHQPPHYQSTGTYAVGLEAPDDAHKGYNPPSLRGIYNRAPYFHDSRARTLEDAIRTHHRPSKLTGQPDPTPEELADLVAFLKSL